MKADEVELNVEYCVTGPLAYGVEPSTPNPDKIRFNQRPRSGWGRLTRYVSVVNENHVPNMKYSRPFNWKRTANDDGEVTWIVNVNDNYTARREAMGSSPMNLPTPAKEGEVAFTFEATKGYYPCDLWNRTMETWGEGIAQPAAIHRTWAEYEAEQQAKKERRRAEDERMAPNRFELAAREIAKQGKIMGVDVDYAMGAVKQAWS